MRDALERLPLDRTVHVAIAALIVTTVLSQGSLLSWIGVARKLRWVALLALVLVAVAWAAQRPDVRGLGFALAGGALLVAFALTSAVWSSFPGLTVGRAGAFGLLIAAAAALAVGSRGRESAHVALDGILLGAAAVAVGGLLVLVFDHDRAVQPATSVLPARYQGLGGGPNTAMMVLAVASPLAALALLETRRRAVQVAAAGTLALLVGSIVASGSRGALLGAFAGLFAFAVLAPQKARRRVVLGLLVVGALALAALVTRIPEPDANAPPLPSAQAAPPQGDPAKRTRPVFPAPPPRLQDDVGRPPYGVAETTRKPRTLFGSSGRAQAWQGAIELGGQRPVSGFGFGTEDRVFFDRYADFNSNLPENSYIGLFLQLGLAGLLAFAGFLLALLVAGVRSLGAISPHARRLTAACAGAVVAGLVLAGFQSYLYAAGNNATAALWICAFLVPVLAPERR